MLHPTNAIAASNDLHRLVALREQPYSSSGRWLSLCLQARELSNDAINTGSNLRPLGLVTPAHQGLYW
jgi:hypothetical protein